ncbi:MAG: hypothetical protein AAFP10_05650 [Pseudomonadota bacterium]
MPVIHHVVVPDLLGPFPASATLPELPPLPALSRLLSRAERNAAPVGYARTLCKLFGLPVAPGQDLPTGALSWRLNPPLAPDQWVFQAHPIHLQPDQDRLLAFDFHHQPLGLTEAEAFITLFNDHFKDEGLRLWLAEPNHWFLSVQQHPGIRTHPLSRVLGRPIEHFLPSGPDAIHWHSLLNEVQMLWHESPPNQIRAERELPAVSGLWLSGGGCLPQAAPHQFANVSGDDHLLQGLAQLANTRTGTRQTPSIHMLSAPGRAVLDADPTAWMVALRQLEHQLGLLCNDEIILYPCDGQQWHWQTGRRWWRRTRPITDWMTTEIKGKNA